MPFTINQQEDTNKSHQCVEWLRRNHQQTTKIASVQCVYSVQKVKLHLSNLNSRIKMDKNHASTTER